MPAGITARLRKNDAFVQQARNSSDINYYNVDSMVFERTLAERGIPKTGS